MGYNWLIAKYFLQIECSQCSSSFGWVQTNQVIIKMIISLYFIGINSSFSTDNNAQEVQLINDGCPMFDFVTIQSHRGKIKKNRPFRFLKLIQDLKYIFQLVFYDFDKIIPMIRSFLDVVSLLKRLMNLLYANSLHYIR